MFINFYFILVEGDLVRRLSVLMLLFSLCFVFFLWVLRWQKDKIQATELTDKYVIESVSEEKTYGDTRTEFTYPVIKDLIDKRIEEKVNNTWKRGLRITET